MLEIQLKFWFLFTENDGFELQKMRDVFLCFLPQFEFYCAVKAHSRMVFLQDRKSAQFAGTCTILDFNIQYIALVIFFIWAFCWNLWNDWKSMDKYSKE